jgi:SagB-type dehydrogenase family enzyme
MSSETIHLPVPRHDSGVSLEASLRQRSSIRDFSDAALTLGELSQLLWAAQGLTHGDGFRTAPSAGALYPLEVYVVAGRIQDFENGVYKYRHRTHQLTRIIQEDLRPALAAAALEQSCVKEGAALLVFSAVTERTTRKYGQRGIRYVHMEAGHAAQNVFLQAAALGIGAVVVGAFDDAQVHRLMTMPVGEHVLYLMPVGRPLHLRQ